jgi:hypothetical protein
MNEKKSSFLNRKIRVVSAFFSVTKINLNSGNKVVNGQTGLSKAAQQKMCKKHGSVLKTNYKYYLYKTFCEIQ